LSVANSVLIRGDGLENERRDESGGVRDEKKKTKNRTLRNSTGPGMRGGETVVTFNTDRASRQ